MEYPQLFLYNWWWYCCCCCCCWLIKYTWTNNGQIGECTCVHMCFRVPFSTKFKMISNILSGLHLCMIYACVCVYVCTVYACQWLRVIKHQYADKQNITSKDIKVTDFLVTRFLCDLISFGWLVVIYVCCCDDGDKISMEMCRWMCVLCATCIVWMCSIAAARIPI